MGYVRLLGFSTLSCGCVVGQYREIPCERDVTYVEQKGAACTFPQHRRNQTLRPATLMPERPRSEPARV